MSIQTTRTISREDARKKAIDKYLESQRRTVERFSVRLNDEQLEDYIEEEFYNYSIDKSL